MNPIEYEYVIIKHEVELGCPETVIRDYLSDHPDEERRLMEEANYHTHGQVEESSKNFSFYCHNPVRDSYPEDPDMYNNWRFMLP